MLDFTMAFQPIVDASASANAFAYEALLRGPKGEAAQEVFAGISTESLVEFDAACRRRAIELATFLNIGCRLSVNISAEAVGDYRFGLNATLRDAREFGWPASRLIFEITEYSAVPNPRLLARWINAARNRGIVVALDDVGQGYANLVTILELRPGIIKLAAEISRGIEHDPPRQALVRGLVNAASEMNCLVIAEGVETREQASQLRLLGVRLMQGYYFGRPKIGDLSSTTFSGSRDPKHVHPLGTIS